MTKRRIKRGWVEGTDWMHLAEDTDQRRALVNSVMKLRLPYNAGNCLTG
jgi:hypothetical protein